MPPRIPVSAASGKGDRITAKNHLSKSSLEARTPLHTRFPDALVPAHAVSRPALANHASRKRRPGQLAFARPWHECPESIRRCWASSPTDSGTSLRLDSNMCVESHEARARLTRRTPPALHLLALRTGYPRAHTRPHRHCDGGEVEQCSAAARVGRPHPSIPR